VKGGTTSVCISGVKGDGILLDIRVSAWDEPDLEDPISLNITPVAPKKKRDEFETCADFTVPQARALHAALGAMIELLDRLEQSR
jgi:hypothetical protein